MIKKFSALLILGLVIYACSSSSSSEDSGTPTDNFDRSQVLINLADNIIIPAFQDFNTKLTDLKTKADSFTATPTQATLNAVRTSWYNAYKGWQKVAMFNIGKAEELQFVNHFNIYPLNTSDVESNITNGSYNLDSPNNHDAQGFPALDYLLYGVASTDTDILAKYTTDTNAAKYKTYLTDVVVKMNEVNTAIVNDWTGGYRDTYVGNTGNTATSSLNITVNDYVQNYEKEIRTKKIGIPAGNFSAGTTFPGKVEAFYKKNVSKELALIALKASQDIFNGKSFSTSTTGQSLKTYLESLNRDDLANQINSQFNTAKNQIDLLSNDFTAQITADNTLMTRAYDELQKNVVYLKTDMMQAFNISIDAGYIDSDGD